MRRESTALMTVVRVAALALGVQVIAMLAPLAQEQQVPAPAAPPATGRGRGPVPVDPRVQIRMHRFAETNEDIPYALFVSSKVDPKKKAPMIVTLHGLGGTHTTMMRPVALDLAEAGGYILVAPMGYNPRGWYGIPRRPRPAAPPPNATASGTPANGSATTQPRRGGPPPGALNDANDPPNLRELSEKETLEVVDRVRKEFTVDDKRTYLMGHSMGGAGTYYLAMKYPERWAGIAVLAPAAFDLDPNSFAKIPKMPVMVIHGDMDTLVPVSLSRNWVEVMKSLKVPHQYIEVAGGDHGSVITSHQTELFAFFGKHKR